MTTINQLSTIETLQGADLVPVYSSSNGDARKASMTTVKNFVSDALQTQIAQIQDEINALEENIGAGDASLVGYQAVGSGSVLRNVGVKLNEFISVKDFGAVGDGVTDDTAAFALALATGNKQVLVPSGTYRVTAITLPSNVLLLGEGVDVSIIKRFGTNYSTNFIVASSKEDVSISGMTIDGNKSAGYTGVPYEIYFIGCARIRASNLKVINGGGRGISFDNNTDAASNSFSVFNSVYVDACVEQGMAIQESSNVIVDSCGWSNNGLMGLLYISNGAGYTGDNITINNCAAFNNGASGIFFPLVGTSVIPACRNVTITGNVAADNAENGIVIQSQYGAVNGNSSFRNGTTASHQGILVNGTDITISGNTSADNRGVGIDMGDCLRVVCDGNTVTNNGIIGIEVNSCENTVVSNNIVAGNNTTSDAGALAAGILVHKGTGGYPFVGNAINTVLTGNIVTSGVNQQFGILVTADTVDTVLSSNICKFSGSVADIKIQSSTYSSQQDITTTVKPGAITFIASATTVTLPDVGDVFQITGTSTINTLTQTGGVFPQGRTIRLRFNGAGITLANGAGNIYLRNGSSVTSSSSSQTVDLMCVDSGAWLEVTRNF